MGGRLCADGAMSKVESGTVPLVLIVHIIGIMCTYLRRSALTFVPQLQLRHLTVAIALGHFFLRPHLCGRYRHPDLRSPTPRVASQNA